MAIEDQVAELLADIDSDGGCMATDSILVFHEQQALDLASALGYVTYVTYANGEHVLLTDAGNEAVEEDNMQAALENLRAIAENNRIRAMIAKINLNCHLPVVANQHYQFYNPMLAQAITEAGKQALK